MPLATVVVPVLTDSLKAKLAQGLPDGTKAVQDNELTKLLTDILAQLAVIKATAT